MVRTRVLASVAAVVGALVVPVVAATSASAHGWVTDPPSRQDYCATGATSFDCGQIKYEPQSVEAPKGSFQCSGGSGYSILDDATKPWPRKVVGNNITVQWQLTAAHSTASFEFFLDGSHTPFKTVNYQGQPPKNVSQQLTDLPNGNHTILARWNIADTANAFYSCMDVNVNGTGDPGTTNPTTPGGNDGSCTALPWSATSIYNGGNLVSHQGHTWKAGWWTQGDEPGTTGEWGVWKDQGACDGGTTTTSTSTSTSTTTPTTSTTTPTTPTTPTTSTTTPTTPTTPGGTCTAAPWSSSAVYNGGNLVSHQGHTWKASWWTQGDEPGTTGEWGVWKDQGACSGGTTTTPTTPTTGTTTGTTSTSTTQSTPPDGANPGQYVVAYFIEWGTYARNYQVKDIVTSGAASKITHLNFAFGNVTNGACQLGDSYADYDKAFTAADSVDGVADTWDQPLRGEFNQLLKLKKMYPNIKMIYSFGGWTWSGGFAQAAKNPAAFANSCYNLLNDPRWAGLWDGIDIDWEYPNDCGLTCDNSGREGFADLMGALRAKFGPDFIISAAIAADGTPGGKLDQADYARAVSYMDYVNPMTYDYFGTWDKTGPTAPHSPLTSYPGIPKQGYDTSTTIAKLISMGIPANKILMGLGFYGRGWTGVTQSAPGGSATGAAPGKYEAGIEDYKILKTKCPITGQVAGTNYAKCGSEWWSYDDPATIKSKLAKAKDWGLAGAFIWELSGDTANGELISAVSNGLK